MKSKIGYNLLGQGAYPIELIKVARPTVVLCMKLDAYFLAKIKPYCGTIVLRKHFDEGFQTFSNPKADAKKAYDAIIDDARRLKPFSNLWMIWNESAVWNPPEARNLRDFYNEIARLFHAEGLRVGAYSFPEGNPADLKLWRYLLDTDCDYIFLHEYDYPTIDAEGTWHVGRWQRINWNDVELRGNLLRRLLERFSRKKTRAAKAKKRIIITEGVLDGKVRHKDGQTWGEIGWQSAMSEDRYVEELKKLDAMLQADPNVEGLCLFADWWDHGKGTYNHDQAWKVAKYIGEEVPIPAPIISDSELAKLVVSVGFAPLEIAATAMAIILAESGGNPNAVNVNHSPGKPWDLSKDQGLVQFNRYWFWESKGNRRVSDWVAFNPIAAITSFYWATSQGKSFNQWSTYKVGAHVKYLERCRKAVSESGL